MTRNSAGSSKGPEEEWSTLPKRDEKALAGLSDAGLPQGLDWIVPDGITSYSEMGSPTAQVHPYQFTTSMAALAEEKGAKIILGTVTAIDNTENRVKGVTYEDKASGKIRTLHATDVIIAAGPWSSRIFPGTPITAIRAHSVTIKADVSPYAIFTEISLPPSFGQAAATGSKAKRKRSKTVNPEMYARPNGEVYVCGEGDTRRALPKSADLVQVDDSRCADLVAYVAHISDALRDGEVLTRQACYLPSVGDGEGPLVGPTGVEGLLMATGHTCWGIQNSAATGKLISEYLWEGKAKSAAVDSLDPRKWFS